MPPSDATLRAAERSDIKSLAPIWRDIWNDGHCDHVPDTLLAVRRPDHFVRYLREHVDDTVVALDEQGAPVGLAILDPSTGEVVQFGVSSQVRGSGLAAELLRRAETVLAARHEQAWLVVVPGNIRARAFYRRHGWDDAGPVSYQAPAGESTVVVLAHRYVKQLRPDPSAPRGEPRAERR